MLSFEHVKGLPFALPGDTVEVVLSNGIVQLSHKGIAEHEGGSQNHIGEPWQLSFDVKEIKDVRVKTLTKPRGFLSQLFRIGSKEVTTTESAYLGLVVQLGVAQVATVLKGDSEDALHLKERLLGSRRFSGSRVL